MADHDDYRRAERPLPTQREAVQQETDEAHRRGWERWIKARISDSMERFGAAMGGEIRSLREADMVKVEAMIAEAEARIMAALDGKLDTLAVALRQELAQGQPYAEDDGDLAHSATLHGFGARWPN